MINMTVMEKFQQESDVMVACEIVSLDQIKNKSYNMDFEEGIGLAELIDEEIDIDLMRSVDEFGRQRLLNRF